MGCLEVFVVSMFICTQCVVFVGSAKLMPYKRNEDQVCTVGSRVHRKGVCGQGISELLRSVCGSSGYREADDDYEKRSHTMTSTSPLLGLDAIDVLYLSRTARSAQHPALSDVTYDKADADMFLNKRREFHQSGIVCECCYNRCGIGEIASYCKDEKEALDRLGILYYGSGLK